MSLSKFTEEQSSFIMSLNRKIVVITVVNLKTARNLNFLVMHVKRRFECLSHIIFSLPSHNYLVPPCLQPKF